MKKLLLILLCVPLIGLAQNKIELRENEQILKKGRANYQAKLIDQPGRAYVTNQRFYFITSKLATKRHDLSFNIQEIKSIDKGGASFRGGLSAAINSIKIVLNNGEEYIFRVWKRKKWIKEVNAVIQQ